MVSEESKSTRLTTLSPSEAPVVRTRAIAADPYEGLKGHAYIKARNLSQPVPRVQTSAHNGLETGTEVCK